ncbi:hypothetical protein [Nonomuraea sp. NPDC050310]|uniref:hypothetical protein n=1 Tax=unclassified Nonomuraea TaxID=2593643 RepID=UPI0033E0B543
MIACCALLMTGCGGEGAQNADGEVRQELRRLREILNRSPALPDGFSARARPAWSPPFAVPSRPCRAVLQAAAGHAPPRGIRAQAAVSYEGDLLGETVAVGMASYTGEEADWHLRDLGKSLNECTSLTARGGTTLTLRRLDVESVGDDVVGGQAKGRLNGYPYAMNVLLVRTGDTVISLVHTGLAAVDGRRTQQLARSFLK